MAKAKQSPSFNDGLGKTKHTSDMLKSDTHIIGSVFDPVKIIGDLIQYQIVAIKIQAGKSGGELCRFKKDV